MKVAVFSIRAHDRRSLTAANEAAGTAHELNFLEAHLDASTAALAAGASAVCPFVNDRVDRPVLAMLREQGIRLVALRGAGFNNVLITGHQAFFTAEALKAIADTTIANLSAFERTGKPLHEVTAEKHRCPGPSPGR